MLKSIQSNKGTSFIGSEKEPKAAVNEINQEKFITEIIKKIIHFSRNFNPKKQPIDGRSLGVFSKISEKFSKGHNTRSQFTEQRLDTFLCELITSQLHLLTTTWMIKKHSHLIFNTWQLLVKSLTLQLSKLWNLLLEKMMCFGIDGVRNTYQPLFNNGNGTRTQKM